MSVPCRCSLNKGSHYEPFSQSVAKLYCPGIKQKIWNALNVLDVSMVSKQSKPSFPVANVFVWTSLSGFHNEEVEWLMHLHSVSLSFQCIFKSHQHVILLSSYICIWSKYYVSMKCGYAYWSTIHFCDSNCEYLKGRFTVWHELTVLSNNWVRQLEMNASVTQWVNEIALHWYAESVSRSDSRSTMPLWLQRHSYLLLCAMHTRICEPYNCLQLLLPFFIAYSLQMNSSASVLSVLCSCLLCRLS